MEIVIDILGGIALILLIVWAVYGMIDLVARAIKWLRTYRRDKKYYSFSENMAEILDHAGYHIHDYKYRSYQDLVFFISTCIRQRGYISGVDLRRKIDEMIDQPDKKCNV